MKKIIQLLIIFLTIVMLAACEVTKLQIIKVSFDPNNGLEVEVVEIPKWAFVSKPSDPQKNGYIFIGWYLDNEEFKFEKTNFETNITLMAKYEEVSKTFIVSFNSNGGSTVASKEVLVGNKIVEFDSPTRDGYDFLGWFKEVSLENEWDFDTDVIKFNITLYAKWKNQNASSDDLRVGTYFESIWATWENGDLDTNNVFYKKSSSNNDWIRVDKELIRKADNNLRVDIVGLPEGYYDLKVEAKDESLFSYDIFTEEHDRSGYAHFNYTLGVGAYKDDGSLKENAKVVYVTEENKNSIKIDGIKQIGLGWILNNSQYSNSQSTTYNLDEAINSISHIDFSITFRIIGKITTLDGEVQKANKNLDIIEKKYIIYRCSKSST